MNIYLVERSDDVGYDEYGSAVVSAASADEAVEVARTLSDMYSNPPESWDNAEVTELGVYNKNVAEVLHSNFNAG